MSATNLCRLCVKLCGTDSRSLYDAIGQQNETYEIAIKYFHPMFLNVDQGNECTVMCSQCWQHIFSFHTFQQIVFEAQRKLLVEEIDIDIQTSMWNKSVSNESANVFAMNSSDETVSLPDLELIEDLSSYGQQYCEDDLGDVLNNSQPLITDASNGTLTVAESTTAPEQYSEHLRGLLTNSQPLITNASNGTLTVSESTTDPEQYCRHLRDLLTNSQPLITNAPNGTLTVSDSSTAPDCRNSMSEIDSYQSAHSKIKRRRRRRRDRVEMDKIIALWRPTLICEICAKSCENFELLRHHFDLMHPEVPFYISCCGRKFSFRSKIEQHALIHINPNAFCCQTCGAYLGSKAALCRHHRFFHSSSMVQSNIYPQKKITISRKIGYAQIDAFIARYMPRLQCILCNGTYANFPLLKGHFTQHHPGKEFYVKCCQRRFSTRSKLKEHIHLHLDPDVFKCKKCGKQSTSYINLQNHCLRIHSRQRQMYLQRTKNATTTKRNRVSYRTYDDLIAQWKPNLECTICHQTCPSFTRLQIHFRQQQHIDKFHVVCCEQKFYTRPTLVEHLRLHSNPDAFRCQICNKSYKFQKSYVDHIRLRHPEINVNGLFKG